MPGFQVLAVRFYGDILETRCPLASEVWEWEATSSHPPPGQAGSAVQASVPLSGQVCPSSRPLKYQCHYLVRCAHPPVP